MNDYNTNTNFHYFSVYISTSIYTVRLVIPTCSLFQLESISHFPKNNYQHTSNHPTYFKLSYLILLPNEYYYTAVLARLPTIQIFFSLSFACLFFIFTSSTNMYLYLIFYLFYSDLIMIAGM